jgi:hypothetical protein
VESFLTKELNMSDHPRPTRQDDSYEEFARKMQLFEDGPTTTNFQQLLDRGIELPPPDALADAEVTTKLWEVISGLAQLRVHLDHTDHLSDKEMYAKLWHDTLRCDTPAIDEIGFNTHVDLCAVGDDAETALYLKYFADDDFREHCAVNYPDQPLPAHQDPPYQRDQLLPGPNYEGGPEALAWLRVNHHPHPFATNRFDTREGALQFVEQLYAAGATFVSIDGILMVPNHNWAPYADTLIVDLPDNVEHRRALFELIEREGRPDEWDKKDEPLTDYGQKSVRLWWD